MPIADRYKGSAAGRRTAGQSPNAVAGIFMIVVLVAAAAFCVWFGVKVIASGHYHYPNQHGSDVTIGGLGFDDKEEGVRVIEGADALFWGGGFCALGGMFSLWTLGVLVALFRPAGRPELSAFGRWNTWISLVCLLVCALCLFPPWRLGSLAFHLAWWYMIVFSVVAMRRHHSAMARKLLLVPVLAAFGSGYLGLHQITASIIIAIAAMLLVGVHLLLLAPHLMKMIPGELSQKAQAAAALEDD